MSHSVGSPPSKFEASPAEAARRRELGRLLPLWPDETADLSIQGRRRIVSLLRRALRAERRRGIEGHWAYDLARHAALLRIYKSEERDLARFDTPY